MVILIRTSDAHWKELARILASVARCVETCARLDAHRTVGATIGEDHEGVIMLGLNETLNALEIEVDHEIDRMTAERLVADMAEKVRRARIEAA